MTKETFREGQRVRVNISETFRPFGVIIRAEKGFCFVRIDGARYEKPTAGNICRYSELTPLNQ